MASVECLIEVSVISSEEHRASDASRRVVANIGAIRRGACLQLARSHADQDDDRGCSINWWQGMARLV